jgi:cytoskeletal protein CcmA (bactofilin family)
MKNKIFGVFIFLALFLLPSAALRAADAKTGDSVYVAKEEIIAGNLYVAGQTVTIDGTIAGDLIAAAQTINVNGRVEGDIIAAGQDITVNGEVGGNVRVAGNSLTINGAVARNVNAFGANIVFGSDSRIGWDVYLAGVQVEARGVIDGNLSGHAGQALIAGQIGKDVNLKLNKGGANQELTITSEALIAGNVVYTSQNTAKISPNVISGQVEQKIPQTKNVNWLLLWLWERLYAILAAIAVGLLLIFIGKNITPKVLNNIEEKPLKMFLPGIIIMFVLPPAALLLIFTLIGIPLALIIMAWWLIAGYIAKILIAILIGKILINKITKKKTVSLLWPLILGVVVSWLIFSIPFVGWIFGLIAVWLGLGGIWTYASHQFRNL